MNEFNSTAGADAGVASDAAGRAVVATLVSDVDRLDFLPTFFGTRLMMRGEAMVYDWMGQLCADYHGGFWNFYTLSNGGGYMAPSNAEPMKLRVDGNDFEGAMSADAAGIVATLFTLSQLSIETQQDAIGDLFHALREFAGEHAEAGLIFGAID